MIRYPRKPSTVKKTSLTSPEEFDKHVPILLPTYEEAPIFLNKEIHGFHSVDLMEVVEREVNHKAQLIKTIKECPVSYPIKDEANNTIKCLEFFGS